MNYLIIIIAFFSLLSALVVLISNNPVFSTLALICVFFFTSLFLLLLGIDFMAFIFLIIYIGAIAVLFLFVVMMLRIYRFNGQKYTHLTSILFIFTFIALHFMYIYFAGKVILLELHGERFIDFNIIKELNLFTVNAYAIGLYLYTDYGLVFICCGLILLIGMLGAITLTLHKSYTIRKQVDYNQLMVKHGKTILLKINK